MKDAIATHVLSLLDEAGAMDMRVIPKKAVRNDTTGIIQQTTELQEETHGSVPQCRATIVVTGQRIVTTIERPEAKLATLRDSTLPPHVVRSLSTSHLIRMTRMDVSTRFRAWPIFPTALEVVDEDPQGAGMVDLKAFQADWTTDSLPQKPNDHPLLTGLLQLAHRQAGDDEAGMSKMLDQ